jgi:nitroreductase
MENITIHELIRLRRSPVVFSSAAVTEEQVRQLMEAARWAPSSRNEQPWHFIYAHRKDEESFQLIFQALASGNQTWVGYHVPLLVVVLAETLSSYNQTPNRYAFHDAGMATSQLTLQAVSLGLRVHPMGGFDAATLRRNLGIPSSLEPLTVLAIGYPGSPSNMPEEILKRENRPRERKPLGQMVSKGRWGNPMKE